MTNWGLFFKKYADVFKAIVVLTAACLVVSAALAVTNFITKDKIAQMDEQAFFDSMGALIPDSEYTLLETDKIKGLESAEIYCAEKGGKVVGYITSTSAKGYGGDIKIMTAADTNKKIIGVQILSAADETPGLGQNVTKADFYSQFTGKGTDLTVVKNGADDSQINAVTGATISSRGVTNAVNEATKTIGIYIDFLNTEVAYEK